MEGFIMNTITINSVAEYVEEVCKINNELRERALGENLLFRGQPDKEKRLIPSLGRKGINGKALIDEESSMVEMARYKLPTVFRRDLEPIELLALLQHHGIPTRLLDVSANALVGLYFACHGTDANMSDDGEVIVFKTLDIDIRNYPMINDICNSYRRNGTRSQEELANLYEFTRKPIFAYAPSYSLRQNIQSGRYILFANKILYENGKYSITNIIEPISKDGEDIECRIIIPASAKKQIRRDLRLLGVSKELLFLDNADMVCREIRDRYSEK